MSLPVWVRVKKATGCCWTWANTLVRRSKTTPSPTRLEHQVWTKTAPAFTRASPASPTLSHTTRSKSLGMMPWSMISLRINGLPTAMQASMTVTVSSSAICQRYGRAYGRIRRTVPGLTR